MKYDIEKRKKLYDKATFYWGKPAQYDQFIEEACELIVAINKFKRKSFYGEYENDDSIEENLIEELADTFMCLEQLIDFSGSNKVFNKLDEKLDKLSMQIEKQKAKRNKNSGN